VFDKILVAVDGSKPSDKAVSVAATIAKNCDSKEITFVHVLPDVMGTYAGVESVYAGTVLKEVEKGGKDVLAKAEKTAAGKKLKAKISSKLLIGNPANEIVKLAKAEKYNLIVIGNKGIGGVKGFFLGSISGKVANNSSAPVLIAK